MRFRGWFPPQRALLRGRVDRYKFVFSGRDGRILREKSLRNVENVSQAFSRDIGSPVCSIAIVLPLDRAWSEPFPLTSLSSLPRCSIVIKARRIERQATALGLAVIKRIDCREIAHVTRANRSIQLSFNFRDENSKERKDE